MSKIKIMTYHERATRVFHSKPHTEEILHVYINTTTRSAAIIQVNLPAAPVKNRSILLVQSFTAGMSLQTETSAFGLGRRCWSSPQQCYPHCVQP